ncbi:unnamed protein product [Calicophoron daubneyi]|uniref:Uncharacterized protein n=1 Tax=Calicophoron daubneyi TaxID=300641 RepID=A0AAV2TEE4_CALDB
MLPISEKDDNSLEVDVEAAKQCAQASCQRVAAHCSHLLEALVIFKAWFIQRQDELRSSDMLFAQLNEDDLQNQVVRYDSNPHQPHSSCNDPHPISGHSSAITAERDWALARMKKAENQINRLRSACFAMRVQLEAGLRYKTEGTQLKRELELTKETVAHYKAIVEEGNKLREDLRFELARVRKEAASARAQLKSHFQHNGSIMESPSRSAKCPHSLRILTDDADTLATTMFSVTSPPDLLSTPLADSNINLRSLVERQARWYESVRSENKELRETVRALSDNEVVQSEAFNKVHDEIQTTLEKISPILKLSKSNRQKKLSSILTLNWFATLAGHLGIRLPDEYVLLCADKQHNKSPTPSPSVAACPAPEATARNQEKSGKRKIVEKDPGHAIVDVSRRKRSRRSSLTRSQHRDVDLDDASSQENGEEGGTAKRVENSGSDILDQVLSELDVTEYMDSDSDTSETDTIVKEEAKEEPPHTPVSGAQQLPASLILTSPRVTPLGHLSSPMDTKGTSKFKDHEADEMEASPPVKAHYGTPLVQNEHMLTLPVVSPVPVEVDKPDKEHSEESSGIELKLKTALESPTGKVSGSESSPRNAPGDKSESVDVRANLPERNVPRTTPVSEKEPTCGIGSPSPRSKLAAPSKEINEVRHLRTRSVVTIGEEEVATRTLTCPSGYSKRSCPQRSSSQPDTNVRGEDISKKLLSLLESIYPTELITWFDHLTSKPLSELNAAHLHALPTEKRIVSKKSSVKMVHSSDPISQQDSVCAAGTSESNELTAPSDAVADENSTSTTKTKWDIKQKLDDFLLSSVTKSPPLELIRWLASSQDSANIACSNLLRLLSSLPSDAPSSKSLETKFCSLCSNVQKQSSSDFVDHIFDWLISHIATFSSVAHINIFVHAVFQLSSASMTEGTVHSAKLLFAKLVKALFLPPYSSSFSGLNLLPFVLDACIAGSQKLWLDTEPLRDAAASQFYATVTNPTSFSFTIATVQALLAWEEARVMFRHGSDQDSAVFLRLQLKGWLPSRQTGSQSRALTRFALSQQTHRIRCLALRLVDACLSVHRDRGWEDPMVTDTLQDNSDESCEAAFSLSLLLSAMAFVVGEEAVVTCVNDRSSSGQTESPSSPETSRTHQRTRRNRQTKRQQEQGLVGWLLTGRLLPWITKCSKSLKQQSGVSLYCVNLLARLMLLTTDVIIFTSHLFAQRLAKPAEKELRSTLFTCGGRLVRSVGVWGSYLPAAIRLTCLVRLISFAPRTAMQSIIQLLRESSFSQTGESLPTSSSYLWANIPLRDLVRHSFDLVRESAKVPDKLVNEYRTVCRTTILADEKNVTSS